MVAGGQISWRLVNTIDGGRYSMHVPARPNSSIYGVPNTLAVMYSWLAGYDFNLQIVGGGATENPVDFRLVRPRRIDAGGSVTVAVEQNSSLCADFDVNFNVKARCENVYISATTAGTLTIEARPVSPGGFVPIVETGDYPVTAASGTLSLQVKAGQSYWIRIGRSSGATTVSGGDVDAIQYSVKPTQPNSVRPSSATPDPERGGRAGCRIIGVGDVRGMYGVPPDREAGTRERTCQGGVCAVFGRVLSTLSFQAARPTRPVTVIRL
jgi:hypothetical protein